MFTLIVGRFAVKNCFRKDQPAKWTDIQLMGHLTAAAAGTRTRKPNYTLFTCTMASVFKMRLGIIFLPFLLVRTTCFIISMQPTRIVCYIKTGITFVYEVSLSFAQNTIYVFVTVLYYIYINASI